jgi:hypothetical protein
VPLFSKEAQQFLENIYSNFTLADALSVKSVERVTNHDVKAVEYVLKEKCRSHPELEKVCGGRVNLDIQKYDFAPNQEITLRLRCYFGVFLLSITAIRQLKEHLNVCYSSNCMVIFINFLSSQYV